MKKWMMVTVLLIAMFTLAGCYKTVQLNLTDLKALTATFDEPINFTYTVDHTTGNVKTDGIKGDIVIKVNLTDPDKHKIQISSNVQMTLANFSGTTTKRAWLEDNVFVKDNIQYERYYDAEQLGTDDKQVNDNRKDKYVYVARDLEEEYEGIYRTLPIVLPFLISQYEGHIFDALDNITVEKSGKNYRVTGEFKASILGYQDTVDEMNSKVAIEFDDKQMKSFDIRIWGVLSAAEGVNFETKIIVDFVSAVRITYPSFRGYEFVN